MPTNRVVASPEDKVVLALVCLDLEVVDFAVMPVRSPDQAAPITYTISKNSMSQTLFMTYSASMI
jgi:hypothetical protein